MFSAFTKGLSDIVKRLGNKAMFSVEDVSEIARDIRKLLLQADVALSVAKEMSDTIRSRLQRVVEESGVISEMYMSKLLRDLILDYLGSQKRELRFIKNKLCVVLLAGLQGAGKTTTAVKLAKLVASDYSKKVCVASVDTYRPAAIEQLKVFSDASGVDFLDIMDGSSSDPVKLAEKAVDYAKNGEYEVLFLDTAGRQHSDEEMLLELQKIKDIVSPKEILLIVDAMTGQDAIQLIKIFHAKLGLTGVVLTKMDGDSRGGVALSVKKEANCSIKFICHGEHVDDIDVFDPERMVGRIMGLGDLKSLSEKTAKIFDAGEMNKLKGKMIQGQFDFNDLKNQLKIFDKIGGLSGLMKYIPNMGGMESKINEMAGNKKILRLRAMIDSMTPAERKDFKLMNPSRKKRIAAGAGVSESDVDQLMRQFKQMRMMSQKMAKHKKFSDLDKDDIGSFLS